MIVLDVNAAIAVVREEPEGDALRGLMLKGESAIAPRLFINELANTISKYVRGGLFSKELGLKVGNAACRLVSEFVSDEDCWREACSEAIRLEHSAYDMFYLVLARRTGSTLFTLDRRLQNLCLDNGVNSICLTSL